MTGQRNWLVIEPSVSGHHRTYLERIVEGILAHGLDVTLGSSTSSDAESYCRDLQRRRGAERVSLVLAELPKGCGRFGSVADDAARELSYRRFFRHIYKSAAAVGRIDRVFVPYLDHCLNALGLLGSPFGSTPLDGICMGPSFHFKQMGIVAPRRWSDVPKEQLFRLLLARQAVRRVFTIDQTLYLYTRRSRFPGSRKLEYLPDPVELVGSHSKTTAREALGIPASTKVVLLYGSLDLRKGIAALLQYMITGPGRDSVLLAVGEQTADVRALLSSQQARRLELEGRLLQIDRYVTDEEEQMVFAAADVAWLRYEGFYQMSGVLVKSAKVGLDLELSDEGLLGWYKHRSAADGALEFDEHGWQGAISRLLDVDGVRQTRE
jgi:hypothetical protein